MDSRSALLHQSIRSFTVPMRTWLRCTIPCTVPEDCSTVTRLSGTLFTSCSYLALVPILHGQKRVCTQGCGKLSRAYSNSVPRGCFILHLPLGTSWFLQIFKLTFNFCPITYFTFLPAQWGGKTRAGNRQVCFRTSKCKWLWLLQKNNYKKAFSIKYPYASFLM